MLTTVAIALFSCANLCYCAAYIVRDIFWLRVLSVIAGAMTFPYFIFQQEVLLSALFWQAAFVLINLVNIAHLIYSRRTVPMTEQQQHLKNMVFRNLTPRETVEILNLATWHDSDTNDSMIRQGESPNRLYLLYAGTVSINTADQHLAHRGPGCFLGELNFLTGSPNMADVVFTSPGQYICWDAGRLGKFLQKRESLKVAFESLLAVQVAHKLANRSPTHQDSS